MTPEQRQAHERLRQSLPSKTHITQDEYKGGLYGKAVMVKGKRYENVAQASDATGYSMSTIYRWLHRKKARYVK